jgi:cell division protein FtsW (lipid II flippase)
VLLGLQILLILGGVLRLIPLTGLTVPLVSYGGTSMLVTGFTIGVVVGIGAGGARLGCR